MAHEESLWEFPESREIHVQNQNQIQKKKNGQGSLVVAGGGSPGW